MPFKLKFFIKNRKKHYTLKDKADNTPTSEAHYKFTHPFVPDCPKNH